MKKISLSLLFVIGLLFSNSNLEAQSISSAIVPQYAKGNAGAATNTARVPFFIWAKLTGFTANTTYRYGVRAIQESTDGPTSKGGGNQIFVHQSGNNTFSSSYGLKTVGQYDSLTTDNNGEYAGWFGLELTGNVRFTDGNYIKPRIILNDGVANSSNDSFHLTTADSVKCLDFSTTSGSGCTGVFSHSKAADKNFAFLYDNVNGSGRPLSITLIEQDGYDYRNSATAATFYKNNVDSISGAWGTIIPNSLANGVRRVENHNLSDGSLYHADTDADGVWATGSINTVNPKGGTTAIQISGTDAPLIPVAPKNPVVKFNNITASIGEGAGTTSVTIDISAAPTKGESISIIVKGGTATNGTDYSLASSSASFAASSTTSQSITINLTDDALAEGGEDIVLALRNASNGIDIGADSIMTITIKDNDVPNVSFASTTSSVKENIDTVWVDVNLANPDPNNATKVDVALTGGTATNGTDINSYTAQTVTFAAGSTTAQTIWFKVNDDIVDESDETLIFSLQNATNSAQITNGTNTITIIDNDTTIAAVIPKISFKFVSDSVTEGNNASIAVSISSADTANDVTIDVVSNGGTAISGTHYTYTTTKLTFAKGTTTAQNVSVSTISDKLISGDHTLILKLQNASTNATIGSLDIFTLNIKDNGMVAISEVSKLYHIQMMPNPAKDILYINASQAIEQIKIMDINGRVITDLIKIQNNTAQLGLQQLCAGIYIVQININGQTAIEKLIVE
ncbi:MAG: Calx-beta domain-containing protein [Bacteroidota bacterium]|nr:Calx-beta domain-containing protein [Bacteroidota bacterium]